MQAASYRASAPRRRSRWRPSWKAPVALVLYAGALFAAWSLVEGIPSLPQSAPAEEAATPPAASVPSESDVALTTLSARAARSVVGIGRGSGFVAWTANGLSLVLTARPVGGWQTGPDRSVTVTVGKAKHDGKLVRTDPGTGLGLVRVQGDLGRPLWQQPRAVQVQPGDHVAAAGLGGPKIFTVTEARANAIWGAAPGTTPGQPVLDEQGRLVGVATGGRVIPIARACGAIRRC